MVAACLVHHAPAPRRHGPEHAFSEVLLFAVDKAEERRGIGDMEAAHRMRARSEAAAAREQAADQQRARARMGRGRHGRRASGGRGASSIGGR